MNSDVGEGGVGNNDATIHARLNAEELSVVFVTENRWEEIVRVQMALCEERVNNFSGII